MSRSMMMRAFAASAAAQARSSREWSPNEDVRSTELAADSERTWADGARFFAGIRTRVPSAPGTGDNPSSSDRAVRAQIIAGARGRPVMSRTSLIATSQGHISGACYA